MEYLDFELPLKDLNDQLENCKKLGSDGKVDVKDTLQEIKSKLLLRKKEIYGSLTPWQRVQLSRHPSRPYTLDYLVNMTNNNFLELHGDRNISDDKAMIGGLGKLDNQTFMFIGQQKGNNIKSRQYRNFGMANPEGYRKALRLMKLAEKFSIPVVALIDTPGAYPGIEAEEKGQAEAIARNLYEMFKIRTQIIVVIIGEGASGGALGIGVGDKIMMLENTWYSVISPESCSSILWRSWDHKEQAAEALKLTPEDMKKNKLIDKIIKEPLGGAHQNPEKIYTSLKKEILKTFFNLKKQSISKLLENRMSRFTEMGVYSD
ncbi:MAG: acetyl-CoA carboxylase carboxyl transferase subunit alpha [Flavobacteriaceae bacterium]|jgi:acetyl-CoA carboxylase carboxyl transferase subunit alpha|nr:acetyl-CoA carboxylase carboxyl transferase subunit alpha [Flavobacteriaceae bacterium]|tara:strand:+ start:1363 stop:2316 length:954 start_codon:yes stop_codon:yes gene_type:complete